MKRSIIVLGIGILSIVGCAQSDAPEENSPQTNANEQVVETETNVVKRVSKAEFKQFLEEHENVQLIDVRTPSEFQRGNIEGSQNIDYNNGQFEANINALDKNQPVLIYCQSGGRSSSALKVFKANGFTHVLELEGGYSRW